MSGASDWGATTGPFVMLLIALIADALIAGLPGFRGALAAPLRLAKGIARWFDRRLNRPNRTPATLRIRGVLVVVLIAAAGWGIGHGAAMVALGLPHGWIVEALVIVCLLAQRRPLARASAAWRRLEAGDTGAARTAVGPLVRFDTGPLDAHGVARAAIEGLAARFSGGLVGTVFWYLLLGLPGLALYRAVGAAADAFGRPAPRQAAFGAAAARLDDALTFFPAVIAGGVVMLAALFTPGAGPAGAVSGWSRDFAARGSRDFRSEGAFAGALGLALGGPRHYDGEPFPGPWIGAGRARAEAVDVRRAVYLVMVGSLIVFLLVAAGLAASAA